jgi:peptidyl-tRNA hydrolase
VSHVLSPFGAERRADAEQMVVRAVDAVCCVIADGVQRAMNRFNVAPQDSEESTGATDE